MWQSILIPMFLLGLFTPLVTARHVQFYRQDYKYIEKFDAFYKIHWDIQGLSWNSAFLNCRDEGAQLFYPKAKEEWTIVKNLSETLSEKPNVTDIFVGIHDEYGLGSFITADGHPTPSPIFDEENHYPTETRSCVMMNMENGSYNIVPCERPIHEPAPYICKKLDDETCPTIDRGYKFMKENKKCYKVNERKRSWQAAMHTCFMEGGMLTVIENVAEAEIIKTLITSSDSYFVGFRKIEPYDDFYTVTGEEILGHYTRWYSGDWESKHCGSVFVQDGITYTSTNHCNDQMPFICEMDVKS